MNTEKKSKFDYILDTSAIIAYLGGERGAKKVESLKNKSAIPFIALSELYYLVWNKKDKAEADNIYGLVKSWDVCVLMPDERIILIAGRLKASYKLGIADSYIASFAIDTNSILVAKDSDYNILKDEIKILQIHK